MREQKEKDSTAAVHTIEKLLQKRIYEVMPEQRQMRCIKSIGWICDKIMSPPKQAVKAFFIVTAMLTLSLTAHAQGQAKAVIPLETPKPVASIPVPAEESAQLKTIQDEATKLQVEFNQKMQQLHAKWELTVARAAVRAKLNIEQLDSLVAEPDQKGGFRWVPRKNEMPKEK